MINTKLALLLIVTALIAIIIIALFFLNIETIEPFVPPEEIIIIPQWGLDPIGK